MAKVCMLVTNPVTNDPRVRREASALVGAGHEVVVLGVVDGANCRESEVLQGVTVRRTTRPAPPLARLMSPRAFVDTTRDGALRALNAWHPGAYATLKDLYLNVRYGGQLPAQVVAAAEAAAAVARAGTCAAPNSAPATPRVPTSREMIAHDADTLLTTVGLNVRLARLAISERADVIHAHDLDTLLAGVIVKRVTGARLVYDFHELYAEQHADGVKTRLWREYYERLERLVIGSADALITVNESLAAWNARVMRAPGALPLLNVPALQPAPTPTLRKGELRTVLYQGGYAPHRGLETLVESASMLRGARLVMRGVGSFESEVRRHAERCGAGDRITFAPPVTMTELVRSAQDADIGVIPYLPVCVNNYYSLPNKLFEYLMAGLAVVGSDVPEIRRVVLEHAVGAVYDPRDARSLAAAINGLVADDAQLEATRCRALRVAIDRFNWDREQHKLLDLYDRVLFRRRASSRGPIDDFRRTPHGG